MAAAVTQENSLTPRQSRSDIIPPESRASQIKQQVVSLLNNIRQSVTKENISAFISWLPSISRNWLIGASIAVCLAILFLPSMCDDTYLPQFLTLSVHHKVIAAYILGLLTAVVLKSSG